ELVRKRLGHDNILSREAPAPQPRCRPDSAQTPQFSSGVDTGRTSRAASRGTCVLGRTESGGSTTRRRWDRPNRVTYVRPASGRARCSRRTWHYGRHLVVCCPQPGLLRVVVEVRAAVPSRAAC